MARLPDADQGRFPLPRLDPSRAHRPRSRPVPRPRAPLLDAAGPWHPGMAQLLLQVPNDRSRPLSGTRPLHPVDEVEEHPPPPQGRGIDHAPGTGVLRLRFRLAADVVEVARPGLGRTDGRHYIANNLNLSS